MTASAAPSPRPACTVVGVSTSHLSVTDPGPSPLLTLPGAVADADEPTLAWHYGDPLAEQRGPRLWDGWATGTVRVTGPERISWLHALGSQDFTALTPGAITASLWLSPQGQVEHWAAARQDDDAVWLHTVSAEAAAALAAFLLSRRFRADVDVADMTAEQALLIARDPGDGTASHRVPRTDFETAALALTAEGFAPGGTWARTALRIADREPRFGTDTDARTLPNEVPAWLRSAVALDKGCYCGQETVARIENIGAPPRRLVLLNLDGSRNELPSPGDDVCLADGKVVGRVGSAAHHFEDGPIALALVKRTVAPGIPLTAGRVSALIDPDDVVPPGPKQVYARKDFVDLSALRRR